tara:strand:+ start:9 stop:1244 length:1236 start_codon:yes stop_codon:yes gene_type:complete
MSDRPTITTLPAGARYDTSILNNNFQALRDAFDNLMGRSGTSGSNNAATGDMDMNSKSIRNVDKIFNTSGTDITGGTQVDYAAEWANKAVNNLVSTAAGGDGVDDYSALHQATQAATSATAAATSATNAASSATTAAGEASAVAPKYTFSTTTSMADPGAGILRYNHGTVASVTAIAIDDTTADTGNPDIEAWIASWDDSTSTIKGQIRLVEPGTPANYAVFNITGLTNNSGWVQLAVTHVDSNGTFGDTDSIRVIFSRVGDKGDTGATGSAAYQGLDYTFSTTTTDSDPGTGVLRLNNGTLSNVTAIYIDDSDSNSADVSAFLLTWDDSTNTSNRGYVRIIKTSAPANYAIYTISGASTDASGYVKLAVTHVSSNGSFSDSDAIAVSFTRTGNVGATGPVGIGLALALGG